MATRERSTLLRVRLLLDYSLLLAPAARFRQPSNSLFEQHGFHGELSDVELTLPAMVVFPTADRLTFGNRSYLGRCIRRVCYPAAPTHQQTAV